MSSLPPLRAHCQLPRGCSASIFFPLRLGEYIKPFFIQYVKSITVSLQKNKSFVFQGTISKFADRHSCDFQVRRIPIGRFSDPTDETSESRFPPASSAFVGFSAMPLRKIPPNPILHILSPHMDHSQLRAPPQRF